MHGVQDYIQCSKEKLEIVHKAISTKQSPLHGACAYGLALALLVPPYGASVQ